MRHLQECGVVEGLVAAPEGPQIYSSIIAILRTVTVHLAVTIHAHDKEEVAAPDHESRHLNDRSNWQLA